MIKIEIISESTKYDVGYFKNGVQYHTVCDTKEKIIEAVNKYLDAYCNLKIKENRDGQ